MADTRVSDAAERGRALDPTTSFIVQAPAGSGKTELLTQRYLALLARVDAPEEVVAITFTNKAAAEMRSRVLLALDAGRGAAPQAAHERVTWVLANAVLAHAGARGWHVQAYPGRLRIQTIDSLCATLTRQMPLLARFGAQPQVAEDAHGLYRAAAHATLAELESDAHWSPAVETLLRHLDNNVAVIAGLLATMLARRDQWLRHVADVSSPRVERAGLEAALAGVVRDALTGLRAAFARVDGDELLALARYAADQLRATDAAAGAALDLAALPASEPPALAAWRGLADWLLTKEGEWRKAITVKQGFPAPSGLKNAAAKARAQDSKQRMTELLARLTGDADLRARLHATRGLPPPGYDDGQWAVLQALMALLPLAVAQLRLVFQERAQVDFTEIAQGALWALGGADAPTDLALALDHRLRHLLVDEFQDTSLSQYALLERLTAGWTPGDGRTLFVVGDPMQSIYRFREADVGLFLRARRTGIGGLHLTPLTLRANFRSDAGIVQWVNDTFARVFPAQDDPAVGAVSYAVSEAVHAEGAGEAVVLHALPADGGDAEAERVLQLIQAARALSPIPSIAVLVRSRAHLADLVPRLKRAGLRFRAIDIEHLGERQTIQDLLALTRALWHAADRVAWLACLRAPWCGLLLADLHVLAAQTPGAILWEGLHAADVLARLSADGQARVLRLRAVLTAALAQRRRLPLRDWVEGTWQALGGPACVTDATDLEDAQVYFRLLEKLDVAGDLPDLAALEEGVARLYALPDVQADDRLQLMTIHKAKGLEFDVVIVPGLGRTPPPPAPRLLLWQELPRAQDTADLLLAPIRATGAADDPIYRWLKHLDDRKSELEDGRVLYVAATRARRRLHLLGQVKCQEDDAGEPVAQRPPAASLLARLWPVVEMSFRADLAVASPAVGAAPAATTAPTLARLPVHWNPPAPPPALAWEGAAAAPLELPPAVEFEWAGETAKHVGSVVHRWLLRLAQDGAARWDAARVAAAAPALRIGLARLGVPPEELDSAVRRAHQALRNTLADERGRWILDANQREARSEYALTAVLDGRAENVIIDRTFVDADGTRWIVDYKTSSHSGGGLAAFLDREQERYRAQLERYARVVRLLDTRPVRLGLYFPLLQGWRAWDAPAP
jgi:ATP-dependent exoDNAse (exonuclease V) beta subunit